jgi:5,10-methylenetetrahydromethanopterin reductase
MPVGFLDDGMCPIGDLLTFVVKCESLGLDSIWIAEHIMYREALTTASIVLNQTDQLKVFPGPISPYSMHPILISMIASTISDIGKGRFGLVLGTGDKTSLDNMGLKMIKPLSMMKESFKITKSLLNGETVNTRKIWNLNNVRLESSPREDVPIYLTGIGPKMVSLALQLADGIVMSAATSPGFIRYSLGSMMEKPINYSSKRKVSFILASVNRDLQKAITQIKPILSFMLRGSYLRADWQLNDLDIDGEAIREALDIQKNIDAACQLISERDARTLTATGTPDIFQDRLKEYLDAGVDYPVILPVGSYADKIRTIELAVEVCR